MALRHVARIASAAVVGGVASLALATPAMALPDAGPGTAGGTYTGDGGGTVIPPDDSGWELLPIAVGAAGGLALAGIGFTVASRRRDEHMAHPA
jgi:hypothetical protein